MNIVNKYLASVSSVDRFKFRYGRPRHWGAWNQHRYSSSLTDGGKNMFGWQGSWTCTWQLAASTQNVSCRSFSILAPATRLSWTTQGGFFVFVFQGLLTAKPAQKAALKVF